MFYDRPSSWKQANPRSQTSADPSTPILGPRHHPWWRLSNRSLWESFHPPRITDARALGSSGASVQSLGSPPLRLPRSASADPQAQIGVYTLVNWCSKTEDVADVAPPNSGRPRSIISPQMTRFRADFSYGGDGLPLSMVPSQESVWTTDLRATCLWQSIPFYGCRPNCLKWLQPQIWGHPHFLGWPGKPFTVFYGQNLNSAEVI